jgi:hypothetical protein
VMVTLGQWYRTYHQPENIERPTDEDIAWVLVELQPWCPTPMLMMWLVRHIKEDDRARNG